MNYDKIYNEIIEKVRKENRIKHSYYERKKSNFILSYYEDHHIIPKCLNGSDESYNRVLLTAKEHYICHKLLTHIYRGNRKIALAFHRMTYSKNGNHIKSSRDYNYARELIGKIEISEETKSKIKISSTGRTHVCSEKTKNKLRNLYVGKTYKEIYGEEKANQIILKFSQLRKGIKKSEEHKNKIRNSHYGIFPSKESIQKNSESNKNSIRYKCEYCGIITNGGNYNRWHGKKCKTIKK